MQYKVKRYYESKIPGEMEKDMNQMTDEGWRILSINTFNSGKYDTVLIFYEKE